MEGRLARGFWRETKLLRGIIRLASVANYLPNAEESTNRKIGPVTDPALAVTGAGAFRAPLTRTDKTDVDLI